VEKERGNEERRWKEDRNIRKEIERNKLSERW
jgi:hypothetical protein